MADPKQYQLALVEHAYQGEVIRLRSKDGYTNATAMCRAAGKEWSEYRRRKSTDEFFAELSLDLEIPQGQLTHTQLGTPGGDASNQGTWVHPYIAIHLAQWLSPRFAVRVSQWVFEWMSGSAPGQKAWHDFEQRISLTFDRVPVGYFGIFRESADIYGAMIQGGVNLGMRMILDISIGQHWGRHWRENGLENRHGAAACYEHFYPPNYPQSLSNPQTANCYPEAALPEFRRWMREVYLPLKLPIYLSSQVKQGKLANTAATNAVRALESHASNRALPKALK